MNRTMEFDGRRIGDREPVFVIAEIGLNHNGDPALARKLVQTAAASGADAVKFQKRDSRALLTKAAFDGAYEGPQAYGTTYGAHRQALELSLADLTRLKDLAEDLGLRFLVSAWDLPSVEVCERDLRVGAYKVASADVTNKPLLERLASLNKPIIMSTGMATEEEIERAVETVSSIHKDLVLLYCVSTYPSDFDEINLAQIDWMRQRFDCSVGYSGHERGIAISEAAVALGASVVERHLTLDRTMKGPDHAASLEPTGFMRLVRDIRAIERSMGTTERVLSDREMTVRRKLGKSLVVALPLPKGHVLRQEDLIAKSPGTGFPPYLLDELVGRRLATAVDADLILAPEHLCE